MKYIHDKSRWPAWLLATVTLSLLLMPAVAAVSSQFGGTALSGVTYAQDQTAQSCPAGTTLVGKDTTAPDGRELPCLPDSRNTNVSDACKKGQCIIDKYIQPVINTLAAMVGVVVTISIIVAGIQYASSADNSQKVSAAKQRMVTSIFVLIGFFFFYAFLNWVIPGGLL